MKVSLFSVSDYYPDVQADPQAFLMDQVALAQIAEGLGFHAYSTPNITFTNMV
jgi:hypothetical protein